MGERRQLSLRLEPDMIKELKIYAIRNNMSLTMYVERIFKRHIIKQKQYD